MKKFVCAVMLVLLLGGMTGISWASDTITEALKRDARNHINIVTITWTDDTGNGVSQLLSNPAYWHGWIISCDTNPGDTAPTDGYDIEFQNSDGIDIFANALYNRDTTNSERAYFPNPLYHTGSLTLVIPDASQNANSGIPTTANTIICHVYTEDR